MKRNCKTCKYHRDTPFGLMPGRDCPVLNWSDLLACNRDEDMECWKWEGM